MNTNDNYILKNSNNGLKYNYSIAFMKAFFSFCVVCCHYWTPKNESFYPVAVIQRMCSVAVLVFILISFYLTSKLYLSCDWNKFKKRLWRLVFPFWSWPILYFVVYKIIDFVVKKILCEDGLRLRYTFKDLLWQMALGSDRYLIPPFWYQFDLIILTILFWGIFKISKKYSYIILTALTMIALWFQYSGINLELFGKYEYEIKWSTGRLLEVLPLACIGLFFSQGIMETLKKKRAYVCIICGILMYIVAYGELLPLEKGFSYGGIPFIVYSVLAFTFFYVFPFEKMPQILLKILMFLGKYSFGVFCIHFGVGYCFNEIICKNFGLRYNTFAECIIIYIVCITVSWLISRIPSIYAKQLVE